MILPSIVFPYDALKALALQRRWANELEKKVSNLGSPLKDYLLEKNKCEAGAKGYIGQVFYKINGGKDKQTLDQIGLESAEILYFYRVCDDAVDNRPEIPREEKEEIIETFWQAFNGKGNPPKRLDQEAGYTIARNLGERFCGKERFRASFERLIGHLKKNLYVNTKMEAYENSRQVGAYCINPLNTLIQVHGETLKICTEEAGKHFGSAAQLLDDMIDLETNVREGINTYPLLRLKEEEAELTKKGLIQTGIDKEMQSLALSEISEGIGHLLSDEIGLYKRISSVLFIRSLMNYKWGL